MRKKFMMLVVAFCSLQMEISATSVVGDTSNVIMHRCAMEDAQNSIGYDENLVGVSTWRDNWFVSISGGMNAFIGKPLGCEDLFGRIKPSVGLAVGKWITPSIGGRLYYQGVQFKDCNIATQDYQHFHADLLWNVLGNTYNKDDGTRFGIVPFVGVGLIHNKSNGQKPFAVSYGVQGLYRLSKRLSASLEIGNTTTFQEFDGYGKVGKFGDNLMSLTAGLTVNIGKVGWKRIGNRHRVNAKGTWKMLNTNDAKDTSEKYSRNDYSGLNSLRARLNNKKWNGNTPMQCDNSLLSDSVDSEFTDSFYKMQNEEHCAGSPVYFFFELGTANLVTPLQLLNLDEIARVADNNALFVTVVGAADSATGSTSINKSLGISRAEYIKTELLKRNIPAERIIVVNEGGISDYTPTEANRQTKVMLYRK